MGVLPSPRESISKTSYEGGWGLKQIHYFGKYLAIKGLWNLVSKESL
jgi:hypothetical protein